MQFLLFKKRGLKNSKPFFIFLSLSFFSFQSASVPLALSHKKFETLPHHHKPKTPILFLHQQWDKLVAGTYLPSENLLTCVH